MKEAFSRMDQFGRYVVFTYGKARKSNSRFGMISTLLFLGYVVWLAYYLGKETILKQNPISLFSETAKQDPDRMEVSNGNFVFAMEINDAITYEPFIDERIWTVQAFSIVKTTDFEPDGDVNIQFHYYPLEVERCTLDHFAELAPSFKVLDLNTHLCLKKNQDLFVSGAFKSASFELIQFQFRACDNSTSSVTCATPEEIEQRVVYISIYHSEIAIDLKNYSDPISRYRGEYFTTVTPNAYREVNYYLNPLTVHTDNGWLTESIHTKDYVQFDRIFDVFSLTQSNGSFCVFNIRPSTIAKVYTRSYQKVQEVIANVNGIVSVSFFALFILLLPYTRIKFYQNLINELFDVQIEAKKKSDLIQVYREARRKTTKFSMTENQLLLTPRQISSNTVRSDQEMVIQPNASNQDIVSLASNENVPISSLHQEDIELNNNLISSPVSGSFTKRKKEIEIIKTDPKISSPRGYNKSSFGSAQLLNKKSGLVKVNNKDLSKDSFHSGFFEDILAEVNPDQDPDKQQIKIDVPEQQTDKIIEDLDQGHKNEALKSNLIARKYSSSEIDTQKIIIEDRGEEEIQEDKEEKEEREERINIVEAIDAKQEEPIAVFEHNKIDITFWEYLKSFVSKNPKTRKKIQILSEGIKQIETRLDIFNVLKKLDEVNKLKILLLEDHQLALFEGLPPPTLSLSENNDTRKGGPTTDLLSRDPKFVLGKTNVDLIIKHYRYLKQRDRRRDHVDNKLLNAYTKGDDNLLRK